MAADIRVACRITQNLLGTLDIQNAGIVLNSTLAALGIAVAAPGEATPLSRGNSGRP